MFAQKCHRFFSARFLENGRKGAHTIKSESRTLPIFGRLSTNKNVLRKRLFFSGLAGNLFHHWKKNRAGLKNVLSPLACATSRLFTLFTVVPARAGPPDLLSVVGSHSGRKQQRTASVWHEMEPYLCTAVSHPLVYVYDSIRPRHKCAEESFVRGSCWLFIGQLLLLEAGEIDPPSVFLLHSEYSYGIFFCLLGCCK